MVVDKRTGHGKKRMSNEDILELDGWIRSRAMCTEAAALIINGCYRQAVLCS